MTTARTIITRAMKEMAYFGEGESPSPEAINDGLDALNGLIASWHNTGLLVYYPPGSNWRGEWVSGRLYAVGDGVSRNGCTYTCSTAHTSTDDDKPGQSANFGTYWTLYAETAMTLSSTLFFDASFERGIVAMLAMDLSALFNVDPSPMTVVKARDGLNAIYGRYFIVPLAASDPALTRMPSQIWPYTIPAVSN